MTVMARQPEGNHRLIELDALRGLAACAVMLYHDTSAYQRQVAHQRFPDVPRLGFGYFGVETFFIISGFVIALSAARSHSVRDFALARIARLFPAYWAAVLLTATIADVVNHNSLVARAPVVLANLTMLQTFLGIADLSEPYWTLAYELSFYVWVAIALRAAIARGGRIEGTLLVWLAAATILRGLDIHLPYRLAVFAMLYYGQLFVFGVAACSIHERKASRLTWVVAAWALLLSFFGAHAGTPATGFPFYGLSCAACAAIVVAALWLRPRCLAWAPLQFLGRISYSLYLTHVAVGFPMIRHLTAATGNNLLAVVAAIAVAIPVAYALNVLVENPGRRWLGRRFGLHRPGPPPARTADAAALRLHGLPE